MVVVWFFMVFSKNWISKNWKSIGIHNSLMDIHQWIHWWKSINIHWWISIEIHWWMSNNEYRWISSSLESSSLKKPWKTMQKTMKHNEKLWKTIVYTSVFFGPYLFGSGSLGTSLASLAVQKQARIAHPLIWALVSQPGFFDVQMYRFPISGNYNLENAGFEVSKKIRKVFWGDPGQNGGFWSHF